MVSNVTSDINVVMSISLIIPLRAGTFFLLIKRWGDLLAERGKALSASRPATLSFPKLFSFCELLTLTLLICGSTKLVYSSP